MSEDETSGVGVSAVADEVLTRVRSRLPNWLGSKLSNGTELVITETDSPSWLTDTDNLDVVRYEASLSGSRSIISLSKADNPTFTIAADEPFTQIDFAFTGARLVDSLTVRVRFDEGQTTQTSTVDPVGGFALGDRYEVSIEADEPSRLADVEVSTVETDRGRVATALSQTHAAFLRRFSGQQFEPRQIRTGMPTPRFVGEQTPIFMISVDTLRYDAADAMSPLLNAMGDGVTVPAEPRVQGHWTAPSHGSMYTGVHPGDHLYIGSHTGDNQPIHSELPTITTLLADAGYKCSSLVSHTRLSPEYGFSRGTFRHNLNNMGNWLTRENDAHENVNQIIRWVESDAGTSDGLFYFLHLFDPHLPYVPPLPDPEVQRDDLGLADIQSYTEQISPADYEQHYKRDLQFESDVVERLKNYYYRSVSYTAHQLGRLVEALKQFGLYEESLIIVTGDHGEEFGERGFYGHQSLYDANIRPFMAVKPPRGSGWDVPDQVDAIDFLPTIAEAADIEPPAHCQGVPMQAQGSTSEPRVTERIGQNSYVIAAERNGFKGIFRYNGNHPDRPTAAQIEDGPVHEEYFRLSDVRTGVPTACGNELDKTLREQLQEDAASFAAQQPVADRSSLRRSHRPAGDTEDRLKHLGYK